MTFFEEIQENTKKAQMVDEELGKRLFNNHKCSIIDNIKREIRVESNSGKNYVSWSFTYLVNTPLTRIIENYQNYSYKTKETLCMLIWQELEQELGEGFQIDGGLGSITIRW